MPAQRILQDLAAQDVRTVPWTVVARKESPTLIEAEALEALTQAPTLRTAAVLLAQYHGALSECIEQIRAWLLQGQVADVRDKLAELLNRSDVGLHLVTPWRVAIVGRPNVGKSSLLNALVGYERAIVHSTAGTTRDLVTSLTAVDGWPVELCDSAGIRHADDMLETAAVERSRQAIAQSDYQLVVFDRSRPLSEEDWQILRLCPHPIPVANKVDLPAAWEQECLVPEPIPVSAITGTGLDRLLAHLGTTLAPNPLGEREAMPFTARQVAMLQKAAQALDAGDAQLADATVAELLLNASEPRSFPAGPGESRTGAAPR